MRKLKLQMHISLDGFVAATNSQPVNFNWDDELRNHSITNLEHVDVILLGRKTAQGFIPHWASVAANPNDPDYAIGKLLTDIPKIVFSKKNTKSEWANATMANGDLASEIEKLKKKEGGDMMVYGGADFVSALISNQLVDEYHLLAEPVALGSGMSVFKQAIKLKLVKATPFTSGIVLQEYQPSAL